MKTLVIAEHDNASLKAATLNAVAAAQVLGGDIDILVAGGGCNGVAEAAAQVPGITKVICADNAAYEHQLAENVSLLVAEVGAEYDNLLAASTANGKNVMPRVAALLDVGQISDILSVESAESSFVPRMFEAKQMAKFMNKNLFPLGFFPFVMSIFVRIFMGIWIFTTVQAGLICH